RVDLGAAAAPEHLRAVPVDVQVGGERRDFGRLVMPPVDGELRVAGGVEPPGDPPAVGGGELPLLNTARGWAAEDPRPCRHRSGTDDVRDGDERWHVLVRLAAALRLDEVLMVLQDPARSTTVVV